MITDIMIDTEFLSFKYDSYILSIGAVAWDINETEFVSVRELHEWPSIDSQTPYGAVLEQSTLVWWLRQSEMARKGIVHGQNNSAYVKDVLYNLAHFIQCGTLHRIWSHGAVCDLPLLQHWYNKVGIPVPWQYQTPRDTRTLFETVGCTPERDYTRGVAHDALDDAVAQAKQVHEAWKRRTQHV